ncbi:MAG: ABC transporter ATP-binding protein [Deltaproteobacteria bacterium]|nr:ABC transporter ATP-binding protein [Deltaproteobacteria bacterium]
MTEPSPIDVRGLRKTYRALRRSKRIEALRGIDLEVRPGEIFGLLGPNGAGKTTLVKILLAIGHATGGQAKLLGRPVGDPRARRQVGYLPENIRFPDFLHAEDALHYLGRLSRMSGADRKQAVPAALEQVGLLERRTSKVRTFSKGMLQRLGLAQALLHRPRLVLLDEPTDGVDPIGRKEIRDVLVRLREGGATVFLNSHMLSEVERVCDRVAILDQGQVLRTGSVEELTRHGNRWRVAVEGDPAAAAGALGPSATVLEGALEVEAPTVAALNAAIDRLRAAGVLLTEVRPASTSLEDVFIDVVEHGREEPK